MKKSRKTIRVLFFTESGRSRGMGHLSRCRAWREEFLRFATSHGIPIDCVVIHHEDSSLESDSWFYADNIKAYRGDIALIDSYSAQPHTYELASKIFPKMIILDDTFIHSYPSSSLVINGAIESHGFYGPHSFKLYCGIQYQAIRSCFRLHNMKKRDFCVVLSFGGSDPKNFSQSVYDKILPHARHYGCRIKVILGKYYLHDFNYDRRICQCFYDLSSEEVARVYAGCRIFITSGGVMLNEALSIGGEILALKSADNQNYQLQAYADLRVIRYVDEQTVASVFLSLMLGVDAITQRSLDFGSKIPEVLENVFREK